MPTDPEAAFAPTALTLDEMLDLLPAADIASRLTVMRPKGRDKLVGCCPVHHERTPSFMVRGVGEPGHRQRVRCYGCGFRGDVVDLMAACEGQTRESVLADLPHRLGLAHADTASRHDTAADTHPSLADDF